MEISMQEKIVTSTSAKVLFQLISYENEEMQGIIYSDYYKKRVRIESAGEFINRMESLFDCLGLPEREMEFRRFSSESQYGKKKLVGEDELQEEKGIANFEIYVRFRRNTDWQGEIKWIEKKQTKKFFNVMQLLHLLEAGAVKSSNTRKQW